MRRERLSGLVGQKYEYNNVDVPRKRSFVAAAEPLDALVEQQAYQDHFREEENARATNAISHWLVIPGTIATMVVYMTRLTGWGVIHSVFFGLLLGSHVLAVPLMRMQMFLKYHQGKGETMA